MKNPLMRCCSVLILTLMIQALCWSQTAVDSTVPAANSQSVSPSTTIKIYFNADVSSSLWNGQTGQTVFVYGSLSGKHSVSIVYYPTAPNLAVLTPSTKFVDGEQVTVILTRGVRTTSFDSLASGYVLNFTIASSQGYGAYSSRTNYPTSAKPYNIVSADFDSDGDNDLATANNTAGSLSVLMNNGDGTFATKSDYSAGTDEYAIAASDLDNDGDIDLAVTNRNSSTASVLKNNGDGTFATAVTYGTGSGAYFIQSADLNGDGFMDLAVTNTFVGNISILLNNGNATFASAVSYSPGGSLGTLSCADVNGDRKLDLVVADYANNSVSVLLGNGNGTFAAKYGIAVGTTPTGVTVADFDGDKDNDIVAGNAGGGNFSVLLNNGDGTFASAVSYGAADVQFISSADVDGDGDVDVLCTNYPSGLRVIKNNGDGTFGSSKLYSTGSSNFGYVLSAAADFDGDGDMDIAVSASDSNIVSVFNNAGSFTVNSTSDVVVANAGDGTGETSTAGQITLRSAIMEAAAHGTADATITVPSGTYTLSLTGKSEDGGATGDLDIKGSVTITGAGQDSTIIDANGIDRVFHILDNQSKASVTMKNLTITGGDPDGDTYYQGGGAILLEDTVDLTLDYVTIKDNVASNNGGGVNVYTDYSPVVTITNSTFSNNESQSEGGAVFGYYYGYVNISHSTFTSNMTQYGGGAIRASFDSMRVTSTSFTGNRAHNTSFGNSRGGAIFVNWGDIVVDSSSFEANSVSATSYGSQEGGAIHIYSGAESDAFVKNSTFRADSASDGGAIYLYDGSSTLTVENSKFYSNYATKWGGAIYQTDGSLVVKNTTLDSNKANNGGGGAVYAGYGTGLTVQNTNVRYNNAGGDNGGGIYVYSDIPYFTLKNSEVSNNYAYYNGGGIYSLSPIDTLSEVIITHNIADESGGGIMIDDNSGSKTSVWTNVRVDSNEAKGNNSGGGSEGVAYLSPERPEENRNGAVPSPREVQNGAFGYGRGGGVFDNMGGMTWDGGSLRGNTATYIGGGLYFQSNQNSTIQNTVTISGNTANGVTNSVQVGSGSGTLTVGIETGSVFDSIPGYALSFDGVDDYAYMYSPISSMSNGFTIEMWVKPTSLPSPGKMVIYSSNGRTVQYGIDSSYRFYARFEEDFQTYEYISGTTTVTANQWYHFAVSVDPGDSLILYVNGAKEASGHVSGYFGGTGYACLGRMYAGDPVNSANYHHFTGLIDEARMWEGDRTASQIRASMYRTLSGSALAGSLFYLQMNENTGALAHDYSNGNNLDLDQAGVEYQPAWAASTAPVGGGSSTTTSVPANTTGTQTIGNAEFNMTDGFDDPTDVVVSEVTAPPDAFPTNYTSSVGDKYFVIDAYPYPDSGSFSATLTLTFGPGKITDPTPSIYILYKRASTSSSTWTSYGAASSVDTATGKITWTNITSLSQAIVVNENFALPVQLESFTARVVTGGVTLEWATATEVNNYGFYIERRRDDEPTYTELPNSFVEGSGTTVGEKLYSWTDQSALTGTYHYRLRQVDLNGDAMYSQEIKVTVTVTGVEETAPREFALHQNYPNPFNPSTRIGYQLPFAGVVRLEIYNILGQRVRVLVDDAQMSAGVYQANFDAVSFGGGVYYLRISVEWVDDAGMTQRFVDVKKMMLLQ